MKEAVAIEDQLHYNEPPDWFFSVRHHLGAVSIEAGHYKETLQTFTGDLKRFSKNGGALHGMKQVYEKRHKEKKVNQIASRLNGSWACADVELVTSRIK